MNDCLEETRCYTNGDMIKNMFPNIEIFDSDNPDFIYVGIYYQGIFGAKINAIKEWWDAPYDFNKE